MQEIEDGKKRCKWALGVNQRYIDYHDKEWGVPVRDDRRQFEFLVLESAQAGLSWSTILNTCSCAQSRARSTDISSACPVMGPKSRHIAQIDLNATVIGHTSLWIEMPLQEFDGSCKHV